MTDKIMVKCPLCGHIFDSAETFLWLPDSEGHPTVESISCPQCDIGTEPVFKCEWCPGRIKGEHECQLKEECAACLSFNFDDFKEVEAS